MRPNIKTRLRCRIAVVILGSGSSLIVQPVLAQPAPTQSNAPAGVASPATAAASNPTDNTLQEVVVTAQFRAQSVQNTPLAITAISSGELEARNQISIVDIGEFAPSVNLSQAAGIQGNAISAYIRGVGQNQGSFALEPGVGIYIDDVYYGTTFGAVLDLNDLDRVEVLRGPQGTLAGKDSEGGAIKLYSPKPDGEDAGFAEVSYGSYDRTDVRMSDDFTIADGLYARVSGLTEHSDGFLKELDYGCVNPGGGIPAGQSSDNCVSGTEGGKDVTAARVALRYAPAASNLDVDIIGDVNNDNSEEVPSVLTYANNSNVRSYVAGDPLGGVPFGSQFITAPGSYTNYASYSSAGNYTTIFGTPYQQSGAGYTNGPQNSANSWGVSGSIDYQLPLDLKLKSITAYRHADGTTVNDPDDSPLNVVKETLTNTHEQFTQEIRLTGEITDKFDFTLGGFYYKARDRQQFRINIPEYLYDFLTDDPVSNRSGAEFLHMEFHPIDGLDLILGARHTEDRKTYTFVRENPDGSAISGIPLTENFLVAGLNGLSDTFSGEHTDYRAGINYRWNEEVMTYAQVDTGYKGGGINPQPFVADQVKPFDPETLTNYEAGFKTDFFGRTARLNGAVFLDNYKNIQSTVYYCPDSASTSCGETTNVANGRYKGVELEAELHPVSGLMINGSLSYLDARYTQITNPYSEITAGMIPPFVSKWQASTGVSYTLALGRGTLTPRVDWNYLSSFYYQAVNDPYNFIPSRGLLDARLSYEPPNGAWTVSLSGTNLTDKYYYVGAADNAAAMGVATAIVGAPREWAITLKRRF